MAEQLPQGWRRTSLGELGTLATSSVDKLTFDSEQPVNLVNYMDVYSRRFIDRSMQFQVVTASKDEVARFQVRKGDILFTPSSETPDDIGHSAVIVDDLPDTVHSYHTVRLRVKEEAELDLRFRGWVANNEAVRRYLAQCATGSTRYTLSLGRLGSAIVALPPLVQQQRIAEILSTVDKAIEGTEKLIVKHQQIKAALMHNLFTRGLTPDGHLRPPHTECPGLYKDSLLGPIPKEWDVRSVRSEGGVKLGRQRAPKFETREGGTPYLRVANVFDGWIDYSDVYSMFFSSTERIEYSLLPGDILLNEGQSKELVGRSALYCGPPHTFCFQNTLIRFRPNEKVLSEYFQAVFKSYLDRGKFAAVAHQTTSVAHLGADRFARMLIPKPPTKEALGVSSARRRCQMSLDRAEAAAEKLRLLRRGLIHDLLTGEVEVPIPEADDDA